MAELLSLAHISLCYKHIAGIGALETMECTNSWILSDQNHFRQGNKGIQTFKIYVIDSSLGVVVMALNIL